MNSSRLLRPLGLVLPFVSINIACGSAEEPSSSGDGDDDGTGGTVMGDGDGTGGTMAGDGDLGTGTGGDGMSSATGGSADTGRVPGTDSYNCDPAEGAAGVLTATQVGSGFVRPLYVTHAPNDARLFVVEQEGMIKINGGGTFLDITDRVSGPVQQNNPWTEQGLLGLAFHPDYATNGLFYVFYSNDSGDSVISEFNVSTDANIGDATSERVVLTIEQTHENHKGGTLAFGADGYLYISVGDGGTANPTDGGDPEGHGQNASTLKGSILRIDPTGSPYTAAGNYPGGAAEVWDIGLRNPFRMSFDACHGDLYIGDVGQELRDEINVEKAGEGGKNYGWRTMEGSTCFNAADKTNPLATCEQMGLTAPVLESDVMGGASITGGAVYRGSEIPWLRGAYLHGDFVRNTIDSFVYDRDAGTISGQTSHTGTISPAPGIAAISNGHDGEVYFITLGALDFDSLGDPDGALYKITSL